jgi:hypothetical protein
MARTKKTETNVVAQNKGEQIMTNAETKKEFNYFDYFKFNVLKAYFAKKLKGEDTTELTIQIKYVDYNKNVWFYKNNAFKFVKLETVYDELGKQMTQIVIKDLNLDAKAISKAGKEFKVFNNFDIAKATKALLKVA